MKKIYRYEEELDFRQSRFSMEKLIIHLIKFQFHFFVVQGEWPRGNLVKDITALEKAFLFPEISLKKLMKRDLGKCISFIACYFPKELAQFFCCSFLTQFCNFSVEKVQYPIRGWSFCNLKGYTFAKIGHVSFCWTEL